MYFRRHRRFFPSPPPAKKSRRSLVSQESSPRLIPCPENHNRAKLQICRTSDGVYRVRCNCGTSDQVGAELSSSTFLKMINDTPHNIDLVPHRMVRKEVVGLFDPTITAQLCTPNSMPTSDDGFVSNEIFRACSNIHSTVCLINVENERTIAVCGCKDPLRQFKWVPYSENLKAEFGFRCTYKYYSPTQRGFEAKAVEGWAKRLQ